MAVGCFYMECPKHISHTKFVSGHTHENSGLVYIVMKKLIVAHDLVIIIEIVT